MSQIQIVENLSPGAYSPVDRSILEKAAQETIRFVNTGLGAGLTILLTDDPFIRTLNRDYRGVEAATDVLAFPGGEIDPDTRELYLGDVVISLDKAQAQAAAVGHPLISELQLLVVHGVLHLLGFDHMEEKEGHAMDAAQEGILAALGCEIS